MAGKLLYRKEVKIKGYRGLFSKECRFNLKTGSFTITYPEKVVKDNIVRVNEVYNQTLKGAEQDYYNMIANFEMLDADYTTVILYQIEERGSYRDGSGEGFIFNWGVYRKIEAKGVWNDNKKYHFVRNYGEKTNEYAVMAGDIKDWKELEWSEQRENFFIELSKQIEQIHFKLDFFVNKIDFEEINNIKLLT